MRRMYFVFLTILCVCGFVRGEELSYLDLIGRLTDLERLAVLPQPGETCAQWSSYDRGSKYDEATGEYVRWEANGDGDGLIRTEGDNLVLAEMQGPGVIWRIWSAMPKEGHIKFYLDGAEKPAIDLPFIGLAREMARCLTARALLQAEDGNETGAVADLGAAHRLARLAAQSPTLVYHLTALYTERQPVHGAKALLERAPVWRE